VLRASPAQQLQPGRRERRLAGRHGAGMVARPAGPPPDPGRLLDREGPPGCRQGLAGAAAARPRRGGPEQPAARRRRGGRRGGGHDHHRGEGGGEQELREAAAPLWRPWRPWEDELDRETWPLPRRRTTRMFLFSCIFLFLRIDSINEMCLVYDLENVAAKLARDWWGTMVRTGSIPTRCLRKIRVQ
jgi:hypothetical protein